MINLLQKILLKLATVFGVGEISKAPGTWGTLAAIPLAYVLISIGSFWQMGWTFVLILISVISAEAYERFHQTHDSSKIVIDEVVGFLVTMMWVPLTWQAFLVGFILFRFFDILKPFPISWVDKKAKGGVGVVADDLLAGIFSNILLQILLTKTSWLGVQIMEIGS